MRFKRKVAVFAVALTLVFNSTYVLAADAILDTLPGDCIGVVRINNLNDAVSKLDMYMAGAAPIPVSLAMLVNMQLTQITGDAMMTGIDKSGSFVLLVMPSEQEGAVAGLLVPLTSFEEFSKSNQNITKLDDKISLLSAPQSGIGAVALVPAMGGKYALAVPESEKDSLDLLQKAIENKTGTRLAARLSAAQSKEATSAPVWGFLNISMLYGKYGEEMTASIEEGLQDMSQEQTAGMMAMAGKMYAEMFKAFAADTDSATLAIKPDAALLTIDTTLRAKDGSEMAKMLTADPAAVKEYTLGGFANNSFAINGVMKTNPPMLTKLNDMMVRVMDASLQDSTTKLDAEKLKGFMNKWMKSIGTEVVGSFSYGAPMPGRFRQVVALKDETPVKEMMTEGLELTNSMYKSMELPFQLSWKQGVETYKGTTIDQIKIAMLEQTDQNEMTEAMKKIYGPDGMQYYMAQKGKLLLVAMGGKGTEEIKSLIDQPASQTITGDMKTAVDMMNISGYTDFALSANIIRLMKGMGEMMQSMGGEEGNNPAMKVLSGIDMQSQSCLVMGGKIADGQLGTRTALPKQHLVEVITVGMQIQQKIMQEMQMQQEPAQSPVMPLTGAAPAEESKEASAALTTWIGKKAPELKMADLNGQTHRVSRLQGKKVVLDFWATWCPPCKESIPHLIALQGSITPEKAMIIGLSNEQQDKVAEFVKTAKINYPVAVYSDELPAPYGEVTGLPTMFLIDATGTITDVIEGYDPETTPQKLEAFLK